MMIRYSSFVVLMLVSSQVYSAINLKTSFESARKNMESIKRADAQINQAEELKQRAKSAILPNISAVGTYTKLDKPTAAVSSAFILTEQHSAAIRLVQPLLKGGSLAAYDLSKDNILLAKFQKDATEVNLYQLVINSFYNLNIARVDVKNVEELLKYSRERVKEIRDRTNIGRSRRGELVEAEAQLLIAESQYQQTLINLDEAQRTFHFYTGLDSTTAVLQEPNPKFSGALSEYIMKVQNRPDIQASRQDTKLAERQVSIAKGGHYPSVDLVGNYYLSRTGVLDSADWDVGVAVVIPLYEGGSVNSAVREASEGKRISVLQYAETLRAAERDVAFNYQSIIQLQNQLKTLKLALNKAEEAYTLSRKDYKLGLVTNLDVLQSLNTFIETKRSHAKLTYVTHSQIKNLEAAIGVLP